MKLNTQPLSVVKTAFMGLVGPISVPRVIGRIKLCKVFHVITDLSLYMRGSFYSFSWVFRKLHTIKTLNIGTPRPATVVVLNLKQFNFTMK